VVILEDKPDGTTSGRRESYKNSFVLDCMDAGDRAQQGAVAESLPKGGLINEWY
jgi:hypothetical protein